MLIASAYSYIPHHLSERNTIHIHVEIVVDHAGGRSTGWRYAERAGLEDGRVFVLASRPYRCMAERQAEAGRKGMKHERCAVVHIDS